MSTEVDTRPKADVGDITRGWYDQTPDGWILRLQVKKDGETGVIKFGLFDSREEAREFFVQLKALVV